MESIRDAGCIKRATTGLVFGGLLGAGVGTARVMFNPAQVAEAAPAVSGPGLVRAAVAEGQGWLRVVGRSSAGMALACSAFAAGDCMMETVRGDRGVLNDVAGGVATGAVVAVMSRNIPLGITTAGLCALVTSVADLAGGFSGRLIVQGERERSKMMAMRSPKSAE